jgi:heme/copper-type cytochrome/quinol oxidase subunit 2
MRRALLIAGVLFAASVWTTTDAVACPLCKVANENTDERPRAYMISILFMLGMMGTVSGSVGGLVWWVNKQERKQLEDAGYGHVLHNGVDEFGKPPAADDEPTA